VRELLAADQREAREIVLSQHERDSRALREIVSLANQKAVPVRVVSAGEFASLASSSAPQGVLASAEPILAVSLGELLAEGNSAPWPPFLVVLSDVTDPHNVGAILRSSLGAGATGVVVGRRRSAPLTASALKAAAGAAEHLRFAVVASIAQAVGELSRRGVWTVGLDADGDTALAELPVADRPLALVAGAEGKGLGPLVSRRCDLVCRIPLYGPIESLNVSVAVAIAVFAIAAKRAESSGGRGSTR
jgi:23S rRNA (guanosine2251-2'-O)-methyltransferase